MAYRECSRIDDAAESCLEALEILEDVYGPDSRQALLCQCTLDNVSIMRGDLADAAANLPRVLKSLRAQLHETDLDLGTALVANARLTFAFARAIRNMRIDCVDRREPHDKESVIEVLTSYGLKGSAADVSRQYGDWIPNKELKAFTARLERRLLKRSKAFLEEALNISRHGLGENHPSNAELLEQLSVVCEVLNQDEESARYESEAANLRKLNRARTDF
jgi:hypothetical protein